MKKDRVPPWLRIAYKEPEFYAWLATYDHYVK